MAVKPPSGGLTATRRTFLLNFISIPFAGVLAYETAGVANARKTSHFRLRPNAGRFRRGIFGHFQNYHFLILISAPWGAEDTPTGIPKENPAIIRIQAKATLKITPAEIISDLFQIGLNRNFWGHSFDLPRRGFLQTRRTE